MRYIYLDKVLRLFLVKLENHSAGICRDNVLPHVQSVQQTGDVVLVSAVKIDLRFLLDLAVFVDAQIVEHLPKEESFKMAN